jgi:DNA (cytosine-5)-methyltransferase 1
MGQDGIDKALSTWPLIGTMPARAMLLRGYGNAIVPQVAAEFVGAFLDVEAAAQNTR